ncbi:MAG: sterol desaturase family protein [Ferruginibacter sp.]|nr:sterol desaturase family protein [Ferruginibacter sp.]
MFLQLSPWAQAIYVFILSIIRYAFFGGIAFLIFYVILKNRTRFAKIQQRWPANKDYQREILYSVVTFFIFALVPLVLNHPFVKPHTTIYNKLDEYPVWYSLLVFPVMLVIHDTYFYFTHRIMHQPRLFKFFHIIHHKSTNPSPWAAFSFNPAEAVIESGIIYVFAFTLPIHIIHILVFLIFMTIYNVYGHLGFELYPRGFNKHWLGKWFNTSVNHNMHHQYFKGNYGLYFTIWDRVMNTLQKDYDDRFDNITSANQQMSKPTSVK